MDAGVVIGNGLKLHVRAVAGVESSCYVDSVDVAFDIGCCHGRVVSKSHVFITHGHIDHIAAFVTHAARRSLQRMEPAKYYVPAHLVAHMQRIIDSYSAMQEDVIAAKIVPLEPLEEIHIDSKWMVKTFPTYHRVRSLGYILYSKRSKLREDLVGRESKEIAALRKAGESVTSTELIPEVAYTGDTTIEVFLRAEERGFADLLRVKSLVTEATYLDLLKSKDDAASRGHIHLSQIVENAHLFTEIQFLILVHTSARYSPEEARSLVLQELPQSLRGKIVVAGRL